jgi:hypothetical protein
MSDSSGGLFEHINGAMAKEIEEEANSTLFKLANLHVLATEANVRELKSMQNIDQSAWSEVIVQRPFLVLL